MDNQSFNPMITGAEPQGKGAAKASFILGLISVLFGLLMAILCVVFARMGKEFSDVASFFAILMILTPIVNIILGVVGICLSAASKRKGNNSGLRAAGFAMSLIMLILGSLVLVSCAACVGISGLAVRDMYSEILNKIFGSLG